MKMTNELICELIRSHVYGLSVTEMSEIYGISEEEITHALVDHAADIEDERAYRSSMQPKAQAAVPQPAKAQAKTAQTAYKGVDLSVHNGAVDFAKLKSAGYTFAILREGYGDELSYPGQKDTRFEQNYKNAKAAGLHIGAYHYMYATTVNGARREAQGFLNNLKGKSFDYPIALDIEERSQYNLPNATVEAIVKAFMDVCEQAGYYCLLYSYESFLTAKFSAAFRSKYDVWCANITRTPSIAYGIHQYSFTGRVAGIAGNVDLNSTSRDYPSIIKNAGKNGYSAGKVLDTDGFKRGDKSLGVYFLKRGLIASGYKLDDNSTFGEGTEKAVNDILGKSGYARNGVAGKGFAKVFIK
jgi:GH25 family lysozyme M1 (1,4-beta-N-acetylmuramidase)